MQTVESEFTDLYFMCPNLPAEDIPEGNKESNKVVKVVGEKPFFSFEPKNHVELGKHLGWFDFEAAAAMTGTTLPFIKAMRYACSIHLTMMMLNNNYKPWL